MRFLKRLANLRRSPIGQEIDEELLSYLEMRTADNIADGMTQQEARREARLRFGNPLVVKEKVQSVELAVGVDDMKTHHAEIKGLDEARPLLPQFDNLTDEQMCEAFRSMDPWSSSFVGDNASKLTTLLLPVSLFLFSAFLILRYKTQRKRQRMSSPTRNQVVT